MDTDRSRTSRQLSLDMEALRESTRQGLPSLIDTERALRRGAGPIALKPHGGMMMKMLDPLRSRTRLTTALVGGALFLGVLMWPVSYQRTVGQTVTIHVPMSAATPMTRDEQRSLARRMKQTLHTSSVQLRLTAGERQELTLIATVPLRSRQQAESLAQSLVEGLRSDHIVAQAEVAPRTVQIAGRVYAMALDKLISVHVDTAGKSDAQVEGEIRDQLESGGIASPTVTFERHGDESNLQIAADTGGRQIQIQRQVKGGPEAVELNVDGIDDTRDPGMTDAQLKDKIERQLRARGLEPTVTVSGDHIEVRAQHRRVAP